MTTDAHAGPSGFPAAHACDTGKARDRIQQGDARVMNRVGPGSEQMT